MKYLSVCSGIEAATQAWHPLGWQPVAFSEIEKFPSAVLAHHYPNVPNWGDMTNFKEWPDATVDVLVGGTPCQSFSVAGLRKGLADPRGNLALTYLAIADKYRPTWLVWENVPGVLSADGGRAFGAILGGMGKLGYGFAYRVLDAQFVRTRGFPGAVPQRRRRVFVVAHLGDWRRAAAVLFDAESLRGNPPPRREAGQGVAPTIRAGAPNGGPGHGARSGESKDELIVPECANPLTHRMHKGINTTLDEGQTPIPVAFQSKASASQSMNPSDVAPSLDVGKSDGMAVAFDLNQITSKTNRSQPDPAVHHTLPATTCPPHLASPMAVRRLTPIEGERLQGFPDNFTRIPWRNKSAEDCPDGPRYKALGNSMAVPCMEWIGQRIQMVSEL